MTPFLGHRPSFLKGRLAVLALLLVLPGCSVDSLLLRPSTRHADSPGSAGLLDRPGGPAVHTFTLRTAGCANVEPQAFVLCLGGREDRAEWQVGRAATAWQPYAVEAVALNYPGYGGSPGPATLAGTLDSADAAFDALRARAAGRPVFVHANSFGCAVALHLSATKPVAGVVLHNPPPLRELLLWWFGPMNLWLVTGPAAANVPATLDALANAGRSRCPAVFLLAGFDLMVPPPFQRLVVDRYVGEKRVVKMPWASHGAVAEGTELEELRRQIGWMMARTATGNAPK